MAYRDEVGVVLRENDEIRRALAKARADARFTALRQVILAFAFGLSWSIFDDATVTHVHFPPPAPPVRAAPLIGDHTDRSMQEEHPVDVDEEDEEDGQ